MHLRLCTLSLRNGLGGCRGIELEALGAAGTRVARATSGGEARYLAALVAAHGDDVEAMARDRKLNPDQRTAGQLRRALRNAGFPCGK